MPLFLDLETTGLNKAGDDEPVEIAIIDGSGEEVFCSLVRPVNRASWPRAEEIHGIGPGQVKDMPTWATIEPIALEIMQRDLVVTYNAPFDLSFFDLSDCRIRYACAMRRLSDLRERDGLGDRWLTLSDAAALAGYDLAYAHDAKEDARACRALWTWLDDYERKLNEKEAKRASRAAARSVNHAARMAMLASNVLLSESRKLHPDEIPENSFSASQILKTRRESERWIIAGQARCWNGYYDVYVPAEC